MHKTLTVLSKRRSFGKVLLTSLFIVQALVPSSTVVHAEGVTNTVVTSTTSTQVVSGIIFDDMPAVEVEEDIVQEVVPLTRPAALRLYTVDMTAYTSAVEECDADPFITADGSHVRDGIIATNILPFGTKVRFPALFGDRVFEVHDRMNTRYTARADIWMTNKAAARQFGLKRNMKMEVIEWGKPKQTTWARKAQELALRKASK